MFNQTKKCKCGWGRNYDSNSDTYGIDKYNYCPHCGAKLTTVPWSPSF